MTLPRRFNINLVHYEAGSLIAVKRGIKHQNTLSSLTLYYVFGRITRAIAQIFIITTVKWMDEKYRNCRNCVMEAILDFWTLSICLCDST